MLWLLLILFDGFLVALSQNCEEYTGTVGSNSITLDSAESSFENDNLILSLQIPSRFNISSLSMSGSLPDPTTNLTLSHYTPTISSSPWVVNRDDCYLRPTLTSTYSEIVSTQIFTFNLLDDDDSYYYVNTITLVVTEQLPMTPNWKLNFTRTITYEIPWLFVLDKSVDLDVDFVAWKFSDPPTTTPSHAPSRDPALQPTTAPSLAPTPLVMDHLFTRYAVLQPQMDAPSNVEIGFQTVLHAPYKVLEDSFVISDPEGIIYNSTEAFTLVDDCILTGYDKYDGFCVDEFFRYSRSLYAQTGFETCLSICSQLDDCLAYDIWNLNGPSFCQIIGPDLTVNHVTDYASIFGDYEWNYYRGSAVTPVQGNFQPSAECYVKSTSLISESELCTDYEGDTVPSACYCYQNWLITYDSQALCEVSGDWTLSMQIAAEFTRHPLNYETTVNIVSKICAEVVGTVEVEGSMTLNDVQGNFGKFYIGDTLDLTLSFSSSLVMDSFELESIEYAQYVEGVGDTGREESDAYTITSQAMGVNNMSGVLVVEYPLTDPPFLASQRGVKTNLYAVISVKYEGIPQTTRRRLIFRNNAGDTLKLTKQFLMYPPRCANPAGKEGAHVVTECAHGKIITVCRGGTWEVLVDRCNIQILSKKQQQIATQVVGVSPTFAWTSFDVLTRIGLVCGFLYWLLRGRKKGVTTTKNL